MPGLNASNLPSSQASIQPPMVCGRFVMVCTEPDCGSTIPAWILVLAGWMMSLFFHESHNQQPNSGSGVATLCLTKIVSYSRHAILIHWLASVQPLVVLVLLPSMSEHSAHPHPTARARRAAPVQ